MRDEVYRRRIVERAAFDSDKARPVASGMVKAAAALRAEMAFGVAAAIGGATPDLRFAGNGDILLADRNRHTERAC